MNSAETAAFESGRLESTLKIVQEIQPCEREKGREIDGEGVKSLRILSCDGITSLFPPFSLIPGVAYPLDQE
jgi:hypothetical protein